MVDGQANSRGIPHSDGDQETGSRSQGSRHLPQECSVGQWSWQMVLGALQAALQLEGEGKQPAASREQLEEQAPS